MKEKNENSFGSLPKQWVKCDVEESFFGDDRKLSKQERKRAVAKDRSKYKKTDRDKLHKQAESSQIKDTGKNCLRGGYFPFNPRGLE